MIEHPNLSPEEIARAFSGAALTTLLAAMDMSALPTALPTIGAALGGMDNTTWVMTIYLLTSTATAPIYGKLSDLFGARRVLEVSIWLFLIGSLLCATASGLGQLVAYRLIQGIGGGGLMVLAVIIIGNTVPRRDQGRYQGYLASVLSIAAMIGPILGGLLVESLSWRWIFLLYLPIGGAALFILRGWKERLDRTTGQPALDVLGAFLLMGGISVLLLYVQALSSTKSGEMSWFSPNMLMLGGSGFLLLTFFVWQERRTREPMLPLSLFRVPVFAISIPLIAVVSMAMFAGNIFLPQFFQFVQGTGPTLSGIQLFPLQLGSVAGALGSGWLIGRFGGYKRVLLASLALTALMLAILGLVEKVLFIHVAAISVLVLLGVGFGAIMPPLTVAVQNAVERRHLGAATASIGFFRSLGGLIGVAIFGSLYAASLDTRLNALGILAEDLQSLTDHHPVQETVLLAAANSFQIVFLVAAVLVVVATAMALLLKDCYLGDAGKLAEDDKVSDGAEPVKK